MKRLPYLHSHLRHLNHRKPKDYRATFRLLGVAYLVFGLSVGWVARKETEARNSFETTTALSYPSEGEKTRSTVRTEQKNGDSVELLYRQTTDSGVSVSENEHGLSFVF